MPFLLLLVLAVGLTGRTLHLVFAASLVAIGLGLMTSRWIVRPIRRLNAAAQAVADGRLDQTVEVEGVGELAELASSFNRMTAQLRGSSRELEARLEKRTAELEQARQAIQEASKGSPEPDDAKPATDPPAEKPARRRSSSKKPATRSSKKKKARRRSGKSRKRASSASGDGLEMAEPVRNFVQGLPAKVAELRSALLESDWKTFDDAVHRLAGTTSEHGLNAVFEATEALEGAAAVRDAGGAMPLLERLEATVNRTLESISERRRPVRR